MTPDLRATIAAALAAPGAPTQAALCAAVAPTWGVRPRDAAASLSRWLSGKQKSIPLRAVEAILGALKSPKKVIAAHGSKRSDAGKTRGLYRCKGCNQLGHNRRACPNAVTPSA